MRVGVYGGSFDPPHVAHVLAVTAALSLYELDEVWVVPTFAHPFAKALSPYELRLELCELAMAPCARVRVLDVERTLGGESRTVRTLEHLGAEHPGVAFRLVIGADVLREKAKWHRFDRIEEIAPPIVLGRVGYPEGPPAVLPDVSSTCVRELLRKGEFAELASLLPWRVLARLRESWSAP